MCFENSKMRRRLRERGKRSRSVPLLLSSSPSVLDWSCRVFSLPCMTLVLRLGLLGPLPNYWCVGGTASSCLRAPVLLLSPVVHALPKCRVDSLFSAPAPFHTLRHRPCHMPAPPPLALQDPTPPSTSRQKCARLLMWTTGTLTHTNSLSLPPSLLLHPRTTNYKHRAVIIRPCLTHTDT